MTTIASTYGVSGTYTVPAANTNATASNAGSSAASGQNEGSQQTSEESSKLSARFDELVKNIIRRSGSSLSFSDLQEEADELEDEFDKQVKDELKALGVDTDKSFQLRYDEKTEKMVCSNHPDKDKIEAYFNSNPDRVEQFRDIVDLRAITGYAQSNMSSQLFQTQMSPQLFQRQMDYLSMSVWMGSMESGFTGTMNMSASGSNFYQGLNLQV
ncbi:hypothetical protein [Pseudodesulfovibrio senegalensis]|jgi:hypothetical protein|uniref:Uncharacterized protein n=1 Tax=Pseudodesulfovibrio senegalensis TaxID=1721087 RepID=A0A6N6N4F0_9BACT|nr:hypothetical protein [Pseudodesulfovibrio senegalensis]KAB1442084.1 hypothetical protein F8A88_06355 [Pseudodesulfovibrio senegalensis]